MATGFVGRKAELAILTRRLERVRASGTGTALVIRGRRQVGKSRLAQEFCDQSGVPYLYYAATKGASPVEAVAGFYEELRAARLGGMHELIPEGPGGGWPDAFRALAAALPDSPVIVVLDEVPWAAEQDELFDGALQTAWDRLLAGRQVLLLLLGSDLHMMERLTAYDRPFFGRADNLLLGPLNPAELGAALGLDAADAIDAYLITGGLPGIVRVWPRGMPALEFTQAECEDPASPMFGVPEAALLAEFPMPDVTRRVIEAVGGEARTYTKIAADAGNQAGAVPSGTLTPVLQRLVNDKRVLAVDEPMSVHPGKPSLYRIADSSMRFHLAIGRAALSWTLRGRPASAAAVVRRRWPSWRGRAVEPVIRQALALAVESLPWPDAVEVGGWWNRQFQPEIDIVGGDRYPVTRSIRYAGSVKWLSRPFNDDDLADLRTGVMSLPGYDPRSTGLIAVSAGGVGSETARQLDLCWGPPEVIAAFK